MQLMWAKDRAPVQSSVIRSLKGQRGKRMFLGINLLIILCTLYRQPQTIMNTLLELTTKLALFVAILLTSRFLWNYLRSPLKSFPGPNLASFTNIWRMQDVAKGRCDVTHNNLHRRYGSAVRMGPNILSLSDPDLISVVYNTKNPWLKVRSFLIN